METMSEHIVNVQCYGVLAQVCGGSAHRVAVAGDWVVVSDVLERLRDEVPALQAHLPHTACAIGEHIVERNTRLQSGDTLVLLPPVSGG